MKDSGSFGELFKFYRKDSGLSQRALANLMGYDSHQYLSNIETSDTYPNPDTLKKMCKEMELTKYEKRELFSKYRVEYMAFVHSRAFEKLKGLRV